MDGMHYTETLIEDAIRLLIEGRLTEEEKAAGFSTEFPHPEFKLPICRTGREGKS